MEDKKIMHFFKRAKRKILTNLVLKNFFLFFGIGLIVGGSLNVLALFLPIYGAIYISIGVVGGITVIGLLSLLFRCPKNSEIALIIDEKGLDEQLVTALELKGKEDTISRLQKQRTLSCIEKYSIKERIPLKISLSQILINFFALLAFIIAAIMPAQAKEQALALHEHHEKIEEELAKIEEVKNEIKEVKGITKEETDEMKKILEESLEELKESKNDLDIKKSKERLETKLREELQSKEAAKKKELMQLLEKKELIEQSQQEKLAMAQEEKLQEELDKLLQQMKDQQDVAEQEFSQSQTKENGEQNNGEGGETGETKDTRENGAQNNNQQSIEELAEELQELAQNGSMSRASMEELTQALANVNASMASGTQTTEQLNNLMATMSQMCENSNQGGSASQQATASLAGQMQSGQNSGSGSTSSNGNSAGGANGIGDAKGAGSNGSGNGFGGGYNTGSKNGMEKTYQKGNTVERVSIPNQTVGNDENLTGTNNGSGSSYTQKTQKGIAWSGNSVNYNQVVGDYANQAYSQIEGDQIPDAMKAIVKTYFEGLTQ